MNMRKGEDVGRAIWKSLAPETRFALLGLGIVTEPGVFGDLPAALVARLERDARAARTVRP